MKSSEISVITKAINNFQSFTRAKEAEEYLISIGGLRLGEGCSRQAWKLGDHVIKFSLRGDLEDASDENLSEVECYRKSPRLLKKMFSKVHLELSCKVGNFVVMDYTPNQINKDLRDYTQRALMVEKFEAKAKKVCKNYRRKVPSCIMEDAHCGNFRRTASGKLVMIDLQCFGDY